MKIAVIAPTEIPARRANTIQVMKMTQALAQAGHQVHLAVPEARRSQRVPADRDWENLTRHYGLQMQFPINWFLAQPSLHRYDYSLRTIRWARRWNADLIYTRLPQAAAIASWLNTATIFEIHDLPQGKLGPWFLHRFLTGRGARRLVSITQALLSDLEQAFDIPADPGFSVVAPDGIDLDRFTNLPESGQARHALLESGKISSDRLRTDRFTAGYTGHLYPGRGTTLLLELACRLPEIQFLIVGGEPQDIKNFTQQLQVRPASAYSRPNVILTGFVPNAELPLYQAACDVLLMPYQRHVEASSGGDIARYLSPMKLFEYMACERVILSSDLQVLQEALNPRNAILLPPDNLEAWITTLQGLQAKPQSGRSLAIQARKDANQYTWEARVNRILQGLKV